MKISIPEPCHENWGVMTPNEQGRFCQSCQKTVVDFTNWSTADIQNYFAKHYGQKVCGRFKNEQLAQINIQIPTHLFTYIPASRKFALALLIVFGTTLFSCTDNSGNSATIGKIEIIDSAKVTNDSLKPELIGKMAVIDTPAIPAQKVIDEQLLGEVVTKGEIRSIPVIMGDTIIEEPIINAVKGKVKVDKPKPTPIDTLHSSENIIIHTTGLIAVDYKPDSNLNSKLPKK
ncbi:MAG: hypothetical protein V4538_16810 [Bacteroidota bacterium]